MLLSKAVAAVSFLIAAFNAVSAIPRPGIIRERHVIHAPIKFKVIHHHNIKKVPIIIKKHLHYYKPREEIHHFLKPAPVENHPNKIREDDDEGLYSPFKFHRQGDRPKFEISKIPLRQDDRETPEEEDYEEPEQSQEEQYEDYEYE